MHETALQYLRASLGDPTAEFRDGQWEAIRTLVEDRGRLLVVQRTGWGKSVVYFVATRLLRDAGSGPTFLVSPLLALMRNQVEAAERIGVRALTINSTNRDAWEGVERAVADDAVDVLLVSPERLANDGFRRNVMAHVAARVGLFVVDEAHCISDWGHDFRPDYRRIVRVLSALPPGVPVLATTATANDRVVVDVVEQLGESVRVVRGPLGRASLQLQATTLPSAAERMAWLAEHLPRIDGSGIVYARTHRDAFRLTDWLQSLGIDAETYTGSTDPARRVDLEQRLLGNRVKALVATSALGMGFDKPDLGFVVHYQRPGSVVEYYQQVGRAGRAVSNAYGVLLSGDEDDEITDYFIRSAVPPVRHVEAVLGALRAAPNGLKVAEIEGSLNVSGAQIQKVLTMLDVLDPSPVEKTGATWHATATPYTPDAARGATLETVRRAEQDELRRYMTSETCLMLALRRALDDFEGEPCGRCAVCVGHPLLSETPDVTLIEKANAFLNRATPEIAPRKQAPDRSRIQAGLQAETGRALAFYGDAGFGRMVKAGKEAGHFDDALVEAVAGMVEATWRPSPAPAWVTCVPSRRTDPLVPGFAERLAVRLRLPFVSAVEATRDVERQRLQENSAHKRANLRGAFAVRVPEAFRGKPVLLVDDVRDSGWTFTVVAAQLRAAGAGRVFPLALAVSVGE